MAGDVAGANGPRYVSVKRGGPGVGRNVQRKGDFPRLDDKGLIVMAEKDIPTLWYAATCARPCFGQDATCTAFTCKKDAVEYVQQQAGKTKASRIVPGVYTYECDRGIWIEKFYVVREDKAHTHGFEWAREIYSARRFSAEERCLECEGYGYDTNEYGTRLICYGCLGIGISKK